MDGRAAPGIPDSRTEIVGLGNISIEVDDLRATVDELAADG